VYSRVSTVSRGAFEWTVGTASTRKRGNGEPLKRSVINVTIAACRNYCRQPAARGIDSYFINFVFERAVNETFWLSATPFLTWGYLLMAAGFALTSGQSIDITTSRIFRGPYLMQLVDPSTG
jgi:hypothetical protein